MKLRLVKYLSGVLVLAAALELGYLAPGSFGREQITVATVQIWLTVLIACNLAGVLIVTLTALPPLDERGRARTVQRNERRFDLLDRVDEVLSRPAKVVLALISATAIGLLVWTGATASTNNSAQIHGNQFYVIEHGKLVQISHAAYVAHLHTGPVVLAGVTTIAQVAAYCLTVVACDTRSSDVDRDSLDTETIDHAASLHQPSTPGNRETPPKRRGLHT